MLDMTEEEEERDEEEERSGKEGRDGEEEEEGEEWEKGKKETVLREGKGMQETRAAPGMGVSHSFL